MFIEVFGRHIVEYASDVHQKVDELVDHRVRTVIVDIVAELGFLEHFPGAKIHYSSSKDEIPLEPKTMPVSTEDHGKRDGYNLNNVARLCAIYNSQVDVVLEPVLGCYVPRRKEINRIQRIKRPFDIDCSDCVELLWFLISLSLVTLASRNHNDLL